MLNPSLDYNVLSQYYPHLEFASINDRCYMGSRALVSAIAFTDHSSVVHRIVTSSRVINWNAWCITRKRLGCMGAKRRLTSIYLSQVEPFTFQVFYLLTFGFLFWIVTIAYNAKRKYVCYVITLDINDRKAVLSTTLLPQFPQHYL